MQMTQEEIIGKVKKVDGLGGMTVNERLFLTGLIDTFDKAKWNDKELAKTIFKAIRVDQESIKQILKI